jgi:hypothetical protein
MGASCFETRSCGALLSMRTKDIKCCLPYLHGFGFFSVSAVILPLKVKSE